MMVIKELQCVCLYLFVKKPIKNSMTETEMMEIATKVEANILQDVLEISKNLIK